MHDDLEQELTEWGESKTPPVDGAFANRLETSLRREMLDDGAGAHRGWLDVLFRPGVVVMAIAVLIFGFAFVSGAADDGGVADANSTVPISTTVPVAAATSQTTEAPELTSNPTPPSTGEDVQPKVTTTVAAAPNTTAETAPTVTDQTTIPRTTVPAITEPTTTAETTTIPAEPRVNLTLRRDGRQIVASWTIARDVDSIVGWVLIASIGGDGDVVATSREPSTRSLTSQLSDLDQTFRIEGRDRGGAVVVTSDEVSLNRDG